MKKDLTGQVFGYWTVLEDSNERTKDRRILWRCQCKCGLIKNVDSGSLTKGKSQSCGCLKKELLSRRTSANLINQTFGWLTVIEKVESSSGNTQWRCLCKCGQYCIKSTTSLTRKGVHSCGCYNKEQTRELNKKDLINQKFGKLTVIEETKNRKWGNIIWKCQCDCGNITYLPTNSLTSGNTSSCGCLTGSIGENNIETLLKNAKLLYIKQYTAPDLQLKRFDFAIINDLSEPIRLIEFDGRQHYDDISGIWNSSESLEDIQYRDQEKNQWAFNNNIPLVRIPYWERDNITLEMLLGNQYLVRG